MIFVPPVHANKEKMEKNRDISELTQDLFEAMSKNGRMTMKELCTLCRCSNTDLKPVLDKYCIYHKKGQYKMFYELKTEYKNSTAPMR